MKNINTIWKYFAGGGTVLAYQAWYDRVKGKQNVEHVNSKLEEIQNTINSTQKELDNLNNNVTSNFSAGTTEEAKGTLSELINSLHNLRSIQDKYVNRYNNTDINKLIESDPRGLFEKYQAEFDNAFNKASEKAGELKNYVKSDSSSIIPEDLLNLIKEFNEYLNSLSVMELCLVLNISTCVFILSCIISILFAVSGNYLIQNFSLEEKMPKLSKIIKLRVKFQYYYILINSVFVIFATLFLIFVNSISLINS